MCSRIKALREENNLTQQQVADKIGITKRKYNSIETGARKLKANVLAALAVFYGTSTDYLLGLTDTRKPH